MGNPKYTASQIIDALQTQEGRVALAAEQLGCTAQTIYNYRDRFPSIGEFIKHKAEKRLDMVENKLWDAIMDGNIAAIIFYLKTQGKERGYVERQELQHSGPDDGPIPVDLVNYRAAIAETEG